VGTFHHAPEPGAAAFVSVGDLVAKGQPVGIVEAMKLMLPVEADRSGRVVAMLVENGMSVEFGERLIVISTSAPAAETPGGDRS
jgi:acetyl-CoA carboxylase biotin carboxyl carrier protein